MLELADGLCMSTVSLYEIAQKVRLGKWAAMSPDVDSLDRAAEDIDIDLVPVNSQIAITAGLLDWSHRDPFDRIIAATAITLDLGLISADTAFDTLPLRRVW